MIYDDYFDRVALMLARMKDGESFSILDNVSEENRERFLECFQYYEGRLPGNFYWWDYDDEKMIITKRAYPRTKKLLLRL